MKRISTLTVIALAAFLLLGSLPVLAVERPFALNHKGFAPLITDPAGNPIGADAVSSGTATHFGLCTIVARVNFSPDPNQPGRLVSSGTGTITSADGEKIQIEFNGGLVPNGDGTATDTAVFRFVGGTGRFAGATGSTNAIVQVNLVTGTFELTMVGNIDY